MYTQTKDQHQREIQTAHLRTARTEASQGACRYAAQLCRRAGMKVTATQLRGKTPGQVDAIIKEALNVLAVKNS